MFLSLLLMGVLTFTVGVFATIYNLEKDKPHKKQKKLKKA